MGANNQKKIGFWGKLVRWMAGEETTEPVPVKKASKIKSIKSKTAILDVAKAYHIKKKYVVIAEKKVKPAAKKPTDTPKKPATTPKKPAAAPKKTTTPKPTAKKATATTSGTKKKKS